MHVLSTQTTAQPTVHAALAGTEVQRCAFARLYHSNTGSNTCHSLSPAYFKQCKLKFPFVHQFARLCVSPCGAIAHVFCNNTFQKGNMEAYMVLVRNSRDRS